MKNKYLLLTTIAVIGITAGINAQTIPSNVPANGLIGWWPFNGNANDESGNHNNGAIHGAVLTTDRLGSDSSAYLFDGSSSYISIPSSASLESPTFRLTMSTWINLAGYSLSGQAFAPILMKSDNGSNAFMYRFNININGAGLYVAINNWNNYTGITSNFLLNKWYMVTAVLDSSTSSFYINDSLISKMAFATNIVNNTLPLEIGRDVPGYTEVFNGEIDDIGIWNRALSQQEISGLYNGFTTTIEEPVSADQLTVYPNPAAHQMNVRVNARDVGSAYTIADQLGRIILTGKLNSGNSTIQLDNLTPGFYILSIRGSKKQRIKIIKQ